MPKLKKNEVFARLPLALALCLSLCLSAAGRQRAGYSPEIERKIKLVEQNLFNWVQIKDQPNWALGERMAYHKVKGMSIAVIDDFKVEWVKAYGWADTAERRPATPATLFQAASIGKSLHAMGCLRLVERGKVSLGEDINAYLRSWKFPYDTLSRGTPITLAHLLGHTAGLTVHGFDGYKVGARLPSLLQVLDGEQPANSPAVRSEFAPGIRFQYSGGGYEISELMVEDLSGLPYRDYMEREVFRPLGMRSSTYEEIPSGRFQGRLATGYRADGKDIGGRFHVYPEKACGAGLWATAGDIARFVLGVQLALKGESNKVLSKEMARLMVSPTTPDSTSGLGVFLEKRGGNRYFQHSGLNEGFSSQYYGSVEGGKGVVILVNSDNTRFAQEVVNSVATVYGWKDFAPYALKTVVELPEGELKRYVGKYQFKGGPDDYVTVTMREGVLYLKDSHAGTEWEIFFTSPTDSFMHEARWVDQVFSRDKDGKVHGFHIKGGGMEQWAAKVE
ncbi:serine hydrolase [Sabulibacter ruber]|uniref:serine hydrolase n=1 Tax=Sabulibacter ruber TaxID=2811901 RepID=UPI001A977952|nr:serine hydrolase [Sabulibacter ruber]